MARAVLVGCATYGLTGCEADVALVERAVRARGFDDVTVLTGPSGTRAGILGALDRTVAAVQPGDAVVIYFSGHGGRILRPDADERRAAGSSPYYQFIVPSDMDRSAPGDFRGILSEELTAYQRRLTTAFGSGAATNVVTILDCCHSGYMARSASARPKSVDLEARMFAIKGIREHAQQLVADVELVGATSPDVVRLVACQVEQSAYELPTARGAVHGVFTDALVAVLDEIGDARVSWTVVGDVVRRRVRATVPEQRPEIEGPGQRELFGTGVVAEVTALPIAEVGGAVVVQAAELLGVGVGDVLQLVVPGETGTRTATVTRLAGGDAVLDVPAADLRAVIESAVALPLRVSVPAIGVAVGEGTEREALITQIGRTGRLAVVDAAAEVLVRVDDEGGRWRVADATGARWRVDPYGADATGRDALVDELDAIATGSRLLDLPSGTGPSAYPPTVEIEFARVEDGRRVPLERHGSRLAVGTPVTLTLRNAGEQECYAWVFDVGVSGRSSLVTQAASSGTRLGRRGDDDATFEVWRSTGEPLFWPPDVPLDERGRNETFVVVVADRRNDLTALASRARSARGGRSPLDLLLDQVRTGTREVGGSAGAESLRYRLDQIEFVLTP